MPRIYDSLNNAHDYCADCFPSEEESFQELGALGDGPDGRGNCYGWDAEHPPYEEEDYKCVSCGATLEEKDNDLYLTKFRGM